MTGTPPEPNPLIHAGDATPAPAATHVCLFAQYDPSGHVPPHTRRYLAHLAGCGLRLHVACAGMTKLAPADSAFLAAIGATGYPRPNAGLDFGAWSDLLRAGCATDAATILLANDSVFGPYSDLAPILARMRAQHLDAWGMVESRERAWHLQSWFICLSAAALARPAVQRVFAQDFTAMGKPEIILHGELGLGVALRAEHLRTAAVWPDHGWLRRQRPVNPSHFDWRAMLTTGVVPFVKAELLRDNPANLAWITAWRRVLTQSGGDPAEIDAALGATPWRPPVRAEPLGRRLLKTALTCDHTHALAALIR